MKYLNKQHIVIKIHEPFFFTYSRQSKQLCYQGKKIHISVHILKFHPNSTEFYMQGYWRFESPKTTKYPLKC